MLQSPLHNQNRCGFFSLLENKVHQLNIPNTHNPQTHCCGSSLGWLLFLEKRSPTLYLFNPLTSFQIHLPPVPAFPVVLDFNIRNVGHEYLLVSPYSNKTCTRGWDDMRDYFVKSFVLSSSPTSLSENYIAVAIIGLQFELAFCKKGDEEWTMIKDAGLWHSDVIYHKGLFYAVKYEGTIVICDVSGISPLVTIITPAHPIGHGSSLYNMYHLVDSFGELLLVNMLLLPGVDNLSVVFEVFRLDSSKRDWEELKNLGDRMLFLGANSSLCLLATEFSGCEGNCIYFTGGYSCDHRIHCYQDSGVFNVGDGRIKALPYCIGSQTPLPPPIWLTPNPC